MKKNSLIGLTLGCALLFTACSAQGNRPSFSMSSSSHPSSSASIANSPYHKITAEEAKKMMDQKNVTIVDVRTENEYAQSHIPGAILVPNESISSQPPKALPDKAAVLLIHCRTGVRSKQASDKLLEMGYTQIYDFGGIVDWPYETESGSAK